MGHASLLHQAERLGLSDAYKAYASMAPVADTYTSYHGGALPGIVQTETYARHVMEQPPQRGVTSEQRNGQVGFRRELGAAILGNTAQQRKIFIGETALRVIVGNEEIMVDQLEEIATLRNQTDIRVVPATAAHGALNGPLILLEKGDQALAYAESSLGSLVAEDGIDNVRAVFEHLDTLAMNPDDSFHLMQSIAVDLRQA